MAEGRVDGGMETVDLAPEREDGFIGLAAAEDHHKVDIKRRAHDDAQGLTFRHAPFRLNSVYQAQAGARSCEHDQWHRSRKK